MYFERGGNFEYVDQWVKLSEKDEKLSGVAENWTLVYGMEIQSANHYNRRDKQIETYDVDQHLNHK